MSENQLEISQDVRLRRLYYRSWHPGCKETDLILGRFADTHLHTLNIEESQVYERLLEEDDADIWRWLTEGGAPGKYEALLAMMRPEMRD